MALRKIWITNAKIDYYDYMFMFICSTDLHFQQLETVLCDCYHWSVLIRKKLHFPFLLTCYERHLSGNCCNLLVITHSLQTPPGCISQQTIKREICKQFENLWENEKLSHHESLCLLWSIINIRLWQAYLA